MSETPPVLLSPTTPPPTSGEAQHTPPTNDAPTDETPHRRPGRWTIGLTLVVVAGIGAAVDPTIAVEVDKAQKFA